MLITRKDNIKHHICTQEWKKQSVIMFKWFNCWERLFLVLCVTGSSDNENEASFGWTNNDSCMYCCCWQTGRWYFMTLMFIKHQNFYWTFYRNNPGLGSFTKKKKMKMEVSVKAIGLALFYNEHYRRKHKVSHWTMYMFTSMHTRMRVYVCVCVCVCVTE